MRPLVESEYKYCSDIGKMAMEMATRSSEHTAPIAQQSSMTRSVDGGGGAPLSSFSSLVPFGKMTVAAACALALAARTGARALTAASCPRR